MKAQHTLQSLIKETNTLPNNFVLENSNRFERFSGTMSDGTFSEMYWQMLEGKKYHLLYIAYGATPEEAKENLKQSIINL